jgi:glycosyltransferase involved in cell wall biosynthesis
VSVPEVSIILPTFNRLRYLKAAVDSVFAQTLLDWELIVADDGSDADTADYLAALAALPRVRLLRLAHTGNPGIVRNSAWPSARGEYIAFLDSDDVWLPEKLALQVASLRSHPQRGWSHTAFALIDDSGELLTGERARRWPAATGWVLESLIRMETVIAIASVLVRRRLLEQVGGFDTEQPACNDYDLWLRLASLSELDGLPDTLLLKRTHGRPYYDARNVFADRARALERLHSAVQGRSLRAIVRRERASVATGLARIQAATGSRWTAMRTLARSSAYAWVYPAWWLRGAVAAARAFAPASMVRMARAIAGRRLDSQ